jgi:hypothetical protein
MLKTKARWRVGAGGQGFVQDAVAPDVFEKDAVQLVLAGVVGRDRSGAQGADARNQDVPTGGVRPGGTPVFEPGQQGVAGELGEGLPVAGDGDTPTGQVNVVQGEFADGLAPPVVSAITRQVRKPSALSYQLSGAGASSP